MLNHIHCLIPQFSVHFWVDDPLNPLQGTLHIVVTYITYSKIHMFAFNDYRIYHNPSTDYQPMTLVLRDQTLCGF